MYLTVERDDLYQKNAQKRSVNKRNAGPKSGLAMAGVARPSEPPLDYPHAARHVDRDHW